MIDPYEPDTVAVYRLYNHAGALLYVGISHNPKRRFVEHADSKSWWLQVQRRTVEWWPDRAAALAEEARAIVEELPAYNVAGVDVSSPVGTVADWIANLDTYRPWRSDLDMFFTLLMEVESLHPDARRSWSLPDIKRVYAHACHRARPWTLARHKRWTWRWADEQEGQRVAGYVG